MEFGYEEKYDILGIIIPEGKYKVDSTVEVDEGFIIDLDKNNKIVQIEIHSVRDRLDVSSEYIMNSDIDVFVEPYDFSYMILVVFNGGEHEIKKRVLK